MVLERLVDCLYSAPGVSWLFRQGQHIFLAILEILRYVMIVGKMFILVGSNHSVNCQPIGVSLYFLSRQGFRGLLWLQKDHSLIQEMSLIQDYQSFILSRLASQYCGIFSQGQCTQYVSWLIQMLNLNLDPLRFILPQACKVYVFGFTMIVSPFISFFYPFSQCIQGFHNHR